jgi:2-keto-4-pentenoate hydratase
MMTGVREKELIEAANLLMDARRTMTLIADLPTTLKPTSMDEAYFVNAILAEVYGEVGGWKIGAMGLEDTPIFAPLPKAWIVPSGALLSKASCKYRGIEAEIAFMLGEDLPPREIPYSREEVLAAVASCHPVIEELESALLDPGLPEVKLSKDADLQMHGALVYGPAFAGWRDCDFSKERVTLAVEGVVRADRVGSNASGDLLGLLPSLANRGAKWTCGLKAGQWITTGNWTGKINGLSGSDVDVLFEHVGRVELRFE